MDLERLRQKAENYIEKGKWKKALEAYLQLAEFEPTNVRVRIRLADILSRLQKISEAQMIYRDIAEFYVRDGQLHKAISLHHRLLELDRNDREVQNKLSELYRRHGTQTLRDLPPEPAALAENLKKVCDDEKPIAWEKLTQKLSQEIKRKDFPVALETALLRWELNPLDFDNRLIMARTLRALDRPEESLSIYAQLFQQAIVNGQMVLAMMIYAQVNAMAKTTPFAKRLELLKRLALILSQEKNVPPIPKPSPLQTVFTFLQKQRTDRMDMKIQTILMQGYPLENIQPLDIVQSLERATCEQVLDALRPKEIAKGDFLYKNDEATDHLFLLAHGRCNRLSPDGQTLGEAILPGQYVNLAEFLTLARHPSSAKAPEDSEVLCLDRKDFARLSETFPDFRAAIDAVFNRYVLLQIMRFHPLFQFLDDSERTALLEQCRTEHHAPLDFRLPAGSQLTRLLFLRTGVLDCIPPGVKAPVTQMTPGQFFFDLESLFAIPTPLSVQNPSQAILHAIDLKDIPPSIREKMSSNLDVKNQLIQRLGLRT